MDIPVFNANIYRIDPDFIEKLKEKFNRNNYYRQLITLPNKGYHNPEYRKKISDLQTQLWEDVLSQLKELLEVDSIRDIVHTFKDYVEQFVLTYYEPSEKIIKAIEQEAPIVFEATMIAHKNNKKTDIDKFDQFKNEIKDRINTSIEIEALRRLKKSIKIPNERNELQIKFKLVVK